MVTVQNGNALQRKTTVTLEPNLPGLQLQLLSITQNAAAPSPRGPPGIEDIIASQTAGGHTNPLLGFDADRAANRHGHYAASGLPEESTPRPPPDPLPGAAPEPSPPPPAGGDQLAPLKGFRGSAKPAGELGRSASFGAGQKQPLPPIKALPRTESSVSAGSAGRRALPPLESARHSSPYFRPAEGPPGVALPELPQALAASSSNSPAASLASLPAPQAISPRTSPAPSARFTAPLRVAGGITHAPSSPFQPVSPAALTP
eukprot:tig00000718_g3750.t1